MRVVFVDIFKDKGNIIVVGLWILLVKERESFLGIVNVWEYSNELFKFEGREDDGDIRWWELFFKIVFMVVL